MFPRRERLPRASFSPALKAGQRFSSTHFTAILPRGAEGYTVVIPKKIARLSVTRHRAKRRMLAALRTLELPNALILFPKSSALRLDYAHMKAELISLLSKIHQ